MDEVQNNSNIIELIADKYIESMNNKNDINNIEDILRDKLGYNSQLK
jgi:GTP1/Obg family GTP-binding protein